jgi:ADP-ribosyl-[dinitrogen reductase] hydrolase
VGVARLLRSKVVSRFVVVQGVPDGAALSPENIRAGIVAYASGDALGVPWEGKTPAEVDWETMEELPARGDWPRGATSDDTAQLMLVADYMVETKGQVDERKWLTLLAQALPHMRGVGPTTSAAVQRFVETGQLHATEGNSIGAAMRALPFGWAIPVTAAEHRRNLTIRLSRATHGGPTAIMSACVVAAMAAWAIEQHPIHAVIDAGLREAEDLAGLFGLPPEVLQPLRQAADGKWLAPATGTALDAVTTVATVLHVLREATGPANAMKHAVGLGGDTDTAAAIVGGILGCRSETVEREIPWLPKVALPEPESIEAAATGLYRLRRSLDWSVLGR